MDWCSSSHAATAHCTPATFAFYTQSHTVQGRSMASRGTRSSRMTVDRSVSQLSLSLCVCGSIVCEVHGITDVTCACGMWCRAPSFLSLPLPPQCCMIVSTNCSCPVWSQCAKARFFFVGGLFSPRKELRPKISRTKRLCVRTREVPPPCRVWPRTAWAAGTK